MRPLRGVLFLGTMISIALASPALASEKSSAAPLHGLLDVVPNFDGLDDDTTTVAHLLYEGTQLKPTGALLLKAILAHTDHSQTHKPSTVVLRSLKGRLAHFMDRMEGKPQDVMERSFRRLLRDVLPLLYKQRKATRPAKARRPWRQGISDKEASAQALDAGDEAESCPALS